MIRGPGARDQRAAILRVVVWGLAAVALFRLIDLQIVHGREHLSSAERLRVRRDPIAAARGPINDRLGRPLAENFASFVVVLDPFDRRLRDRDRLAAVVGRVAEVVGRDSLEFRRHVEKGRTRSFHPVRLARNLTAVEVARLEEERADLPGVSVRVEPIRRYPEGQLAAHAIGHMGEAPADADGASSILPDEPIGRAGLERSFQDDLHGSHGVRFVEVDARGRIRRFSGVAPPVNAIAGDRLTSTLDLDLQRALESALDHAIDRGNAERAEGPAPTLPLSFAGAAVAIDVWSGEVYAMVSRPTFDPNAFAVGMTDAQWRALASDPERPLLNRVIQATYPPGSVFKMAVCLAALDAGVVTQSATLKPCTGGHRFGDRSFACWYRPGHGALSMTGAIMQSCDVYFYQLGERLGVDGIAAAASRLGLDAVTGIDIPGEVHGLIPTSAFLDEQYGPSGWGRGAALNHSIGQGEYLMTPLAMAVYTALIANGGARVEPHLWREIEHPDGTGEAAASPRVLVVPDWHDELAEMREAMRRTVEGDGTGANARVSGLSIAGKTATVQNPHGEDHAIFASFAPAHDPHLALVVVLERRGGGGRWAAPVAAEFWRAYREWRSVDDGEVG